MKVDLGAVLGLIDWYLSVEPAVGGDRPTFLRLSPRRSDPLYARVPYTASRGSFVVKARQASIPVPRLKISCK